MYKGMFTRLYFHAKIFSMETVPKIRAFPRFFFMCVFLNVAADFAAVLHVLAPFQWG